MTKQQEKATRAVEELASHISDANFYLRQIMLTCDPDSRWVELADRFRPELDRLERILNGEVAIAQAQGELAMGSAS